LQFKNSRFDPLVCLMHLLSELSWVKRILDNTRVAFVL
jgi:hypothetical protein